MTVSKDRAKIYHKYRLPYAEGTAEGILNLAGLSEDTTVVELGSGTGILTRQFLKHCSRIFAIEPEASFREIAESELETDAAFRSIAAFAQDTGLGRESCDIGVTANTLHRLPLNPTLTELNRILHKPAILCSVGYRIHDPRLKEVLHTKLERLHNWKARLEKSRFVKDESKFFKSQSIKTISIFSEYKENIEEFVGAALAGIESPDPDDPEYQAFIDIHKSAFKQISHNDLWYFTYETVITCGELKPALTDGF